MNRILLLDKGVAELIAAGEVVERPASAVKELLENAIDAGATAVTLEIKNGGVSFIRVTDNGSGILREDIKAAFMRHATSKVHTAADLEAIGTLGFRGEALASIAAVSRVELITRTRDELAGSRIALEGGNVVQTGDAGCPQGTTIIVRELFYNTPARMKFLKKDISEGNAVSAVAVRLALSHPEVSIKFIKDGREELHTPGDSRLISAIHSTLGREFAQGLIQADYELSGVKITGFVIKPMNARASRSFQHFFLNGRMIRSKTAVAALDEAYKGSIMVGRYAACVLCIGLSPSLVDVNVHPAKIEVRFANEKQVFDAVYYAVKNAIATLDTRPEFTLRQGAVYKASAFEQSAAVKPQLAIELPRGAQLDSGMVLMQDPGLMQSTVRPFYEPVRSGSVRVIERDDELPDMHENSAQQRIMAGEADNALIGAADKVLQTPADKNPQDFRVAGQCFNTYLIVETGGELLLIDKHAAHERVLYEELKSQGETAAQQLIAPKAVSLTREEYGVLLENIGLIKTAGFVAEDFGGGALIVRAAPAYLDENEIESVLSEMAQCLIDGKKDMTPAKLEALYHSVACRAAIKAGDKTGLFEAEKLVRRILEFDDIRYCPHGRPVAMVIKRSDIEKQFGRA
jgi:DNA mismatch repair protein MutL